MNETKKKYQTKILVKKNSDDPADYPFDWDYTTDDEGNMLIPHFSEGLCPVGCDDKWGFINMSGEEVIPLIYEDVSYTFDIFNEGLAGVQQNGKWGVINKSGEEVIPFIYEHVLCFYEGLAGVKQNGKWGYIDKTGAIVVPMKYDTVYGFENGLAEVGYSNYEEKEWWNWWLLGLINRAGEELIPPIYDTIDTLFNGTFALQKDEKWIIVDATGKSLYDDVHECYSWTYRVRLNGKYGYIFGNDKIATSLKYEDAGSYFGSDFAKVQCNGKWGFINKKGEEVIPLQYDDVNSFYEGLARVQINEKYGYINAKGKCVIPLIYDDANHFTEGGLAKVKLDGMKFEIDLQGNRKNIEGNTEKYFYEFGAYEPDDTKKKTPELEELSNRIKEKLKK
jgi:hypothetical protein